MIDIGANLASGDFDQDLDAVLARAWEAGLSAIVITGSSAHSNAAALALARRHRERLYATAGLHPHHAEEWNSGFARDLRAFCAEGPVRAVGECGLDYFRDLSPRACQRQVFAAQLEIAADTGKPVFLHQREAHADFVAVLREYRARLSGVVVHCFTDTRAALDDYLELGCHIGITGWICDERRGTGLLETARHIPEERLLIETDAPYLMPRTAPRSWRRRHRNEPCLLPYVRDRLAQTRGVDPATLAARTSLNARHFFGLAAPEVNA